jgi:hypothetical protein
MRRIVLKRTRDINTWAIVSDKGFVLIEKRFDEEQQAVDWATHYMSSFSGINYCLEVDYGIYGKRTHEEEPKKTPGN